MSKVFTVMYDHEDDDGLKSFGMTERFATHSEALDAVESLNASPYYTNVQLIWPECDGIDDADEEPVDNTPWWITHECHGCGAYLKGGHDTCPQCGSSELSEVAQ